MNNLREGGEQLERELTPEPMLRPAAGSFLLHGALAGSLVFYAFLNGMFHHNSWGGGGAGGAIQVSLVSSTIPLPQDHPPNENVLATDTPSQAPTEPTPKAKEAVDETAIPILGKQKKPQPQTMQKSQQKPTQVNRAQYGEQAGSQMARATQSGPVGPTVVGDGDFGSRFGWYVAQINSKMATSWYKPEVDPRTPRGARVYLVFTIRHDGSPTDVQIDKSSGAPSLDRSCQRGVQRVDTFGILPQGYNQSTLKVSYYCEY
jgi:protein TonB